MYDARDLRVYVSTLAGAACWGLIGLFITPLYNKGFTPWDVVAIRGVLSFAFLILFMLVFKRDQLKTHLRDHVFFASAGILGIALYNYFYFDVFSKSNLSLAVTLLYTGPLFVTVLSRVFFKEYFTGKKAIGVVLSLLGCALVVGLLPFGEGSMSYQILFLGIMSGFCYALFSIFSKPVSGRYSALTVTTYNLLYTSVFMLLTSNITSKAEMFQSPDVWIYSFLLAIVGTIGGFLLYTLGLKSLEASKASILTTVEPVVAVLTGVLFLGEYLNFWQVAGIFIVLWSSTIVSKAEANVPS
ncbi:DMT family transporter [Salinicoccus bachuensis]|uniref:DMT family transporter n=1 Tax=Salinicoccus bachuensis TaxID=3136731 RepID=A0ABZ3CIM0_9STAP